ncbi:MAG: S-(hydroxymethyl)glutathione dehydrogenase/alcohol dehydrogenase [Glaciecola sp.]|jgi:S-(hydroxymethyl)glutathione dehydrogenase/alcohol dehydrogenase
MPITTRAAVTEIGGQAPVIQDVQLADPKPHEVMLRVVSTSVCHTDVAWSDGVLFPHFPVITGHEVAGVVEAVGSGVSRVKKGDRVALALSLHCGRCDYCETGRPMLCMDKVNTPTRFTRNGQNIIQGFGSAGFSELTVVPESSVIKVPDGVPLDIAAVVGCATSTGLGAVFNIAKVEYGSTVAIQGAGGIGLNTLMGCVLAGAERIVVADPNPERRQIALDFGATDVVDGSDDAFREIAPDGFEFVFECVGQASTLAQAVGITRRGGTATLIGAPPPDAELRINALEFVPSQKRILGCLTGNVRPNLDFPRYFRLFAAGKLPLDKLVTGTVPFTEIDKAFEMNRTADGIRTVVRVTEE